MQGQRSITLLTKTDLIKFSSGPGFDGDLAKEASVAEFLDQGDIRAARVSQLIDYNPDYHVLRMSRLPGQPLVSDISKEKEILSALKGCEQEKIGKKIGQFLAELHSIPVSQKEIDQYPVDGFAAWHPDLLLRDREAFAPDRRFESALAYISNFSRHHDKLALLHMDLGPANILSDNDGNFGVIDFGACYVSFTHLDWVRVITFFPPEIWSPALSEYEQHFASGVNTDLLQGALDYYYYVRLGVIVRNGYDHNPTIEPVVL